MILISSGGKDKKGGSAETSGAPLVFVPNGKESRMKDEEKMKTLKWNFASPRAEFIEQLKEQMQPCASTALFTQLFHDDQGQLLIEYDLKIALSFERAVDTYSFLILMRKV